MAELLFIQPEEATRTTILGGNVDIDKYQFCILNAQITAIEPLLGSELYDYLIDNYATLSGDYLTLMNEYVKPITKNHAVGKYITISSYALDNAGLYKHAPDNAEIVDRDEAQQLAQEYFGMAQMYIKRFEKWICKNPLTEYKKSQDDVNARNIKVTAGWYFGGRIGLDEGDLW